MVELREASGCVEFRVRVVPRASRTEILGEMDGAVKLRVSSPPVDGAANAEVVKFLAKTFGVPRSAVGIVSGETSRTKLLRITGVTAAFLRERLSGGQPSQHS